MPEIEKLINQISGLILPTELYYQCICNNFVAIYEVLTKNFDSRFNTDEHNIEYGFLYHKRVTQYSKINHLIEKKEANGSRVSIAINTVLCNLKNFLDKIKEMESKFMQVEQLATNLDQYARKSIPDKAQFFKILKSRLYEQIPVELYEIIGKLLPDLKRNIDNVSPILMAKLLLQTLLNGFNGKLWQLDHGEIFFLMPLYDEHTFTLCINENTYITLNLSENPPQATLHEYEKSGDGYKQISTNLELNSVCDNKNTFHFPNASEDEKIHTYDQFTISYNESSNSLSLHFSNDPFLGQYIYKWYPAPLQATESDDDADTCTSAPESGTWLRKPMAQHPDGQPQQGSTFFYPSSTTSSEQDTIDTFINEQQASTQLLKLTGGLYDLLKLATQALQKGVDDKDMICQLSPKGQQQVQAILQQPEQGNTLQAKVKKTIALLGLDPNNLAATGTPKLSKCFQNKAVVSASRR